MATTKAFGQQEELRMDWQISNAKGCICLRKFKETDNREWLEKAEAHFEAANFLLAHLSSVFPGPDDIGDFLNLERVMGMETGASMVGDSGLGREPLGAA